MSFETTITIFMIIVIAWVLLGSTETFDDARARQVIDTYKKNPAITFRDYLRKTGGSAVEYHDTKLLQNKGSLTFDNVIHRLD